VSLKKALKPLASLEFTLATLGVLMLLVVLCTLAQVQIGTFNAIDVYFRRFFLYKTVSGVSVPVFPAGGAVGLLLFLNLSVVLWQRVQWTRKKAGIALIHVGLALFVIGEFATGMLAEESHLSVEEGRSKNWSESPRADELVVVDVSEPETETVYSIRDRALREGRRFAHPQWPFSLRVRRFFPNAEVGPKPPALASASVADKGIGATSVIRPMPEVSRDDRRNMRAAFIDVMDGEKRIGTWLVSSFINGHQDFVSGGRRWTLAIRPKRTYLPFTLTLKDFTHDRYAGTDIPKNFSSLVRLRNPAEGEERDVLIYMNNPLRYGGYTFYQASFGKEDTLSVLQVVRNPGWLLPYFSFAIVTLGLLFQFGSHLYGMKTKGAARESSTRSPKATAVARAAAAVSLLVILAALRPPAKGVVDGPGFGRLPVLHNGRIKPLDSIARTSLLILHAKQTLKDGGERLSASRWLLELVSEPEIANRRRVFTIHDPDLLGLIGFRQETRKSYSFNELEPKFSEISSQAERASQKEAQQRTRFERAAFSLHQRLLLYRRLQSSLGVPEAEDFGRELEEYEIAALAGLEAFNAHMDGGGGSDSFVGSEALGRLGGFFTRYRRLAEAAYFKAVPPPQGRPIDEWKNVGESLLISMKDGSVRPAVRSYAAMTAAAAKRDGAAFDSALSSYARSLHERFPGESKKARYEAWFNNAAPFYRGMILYVLAALVVAAGWLLGRGDLIRASLWPLGVGLFAHTFGLVSRMVLESRPPVTNLYSSAVFVGWVGVLGGFFLERVHRRGIASFAAAALGFATLIIAHHLSMSGDTLEMMQAVLDSNFWLGTHVITITVGYSGAFLAGLLAHVYLFRRMAGSLDKESKQSLYQMTYGVVCFALFFSFIGTILGGIWADQSWGRFWGWDPKENGAFLIVVWNAMILHARLAGSVRETGFMGMAVFGNVVTAFSWFGVNMLGIGLHSYGFMDKAFWWLVAFSAVEFAVLATAFLRPLPRPAAKSA
jgi:ABC-type transport system involved in cytochrome c biogenesis permease subunit